jgi:hypothetical protein
VLEKEQETQEIKEVLDHSDDDLFDNNQTIKFALEYIKYLKEVCPSCITNILAWRRARQWDYPLLAQMARDFLAILASSSPFERVFSIVGDLVIKKRNRLSGKRIKQIICLRA